MVGRRAFLVLAIALLVLTAGCEPKLYIFDFAYEQDLSNDEGSWSFSVPGEHSFDPLGFIPEGIMICSPFKYSGDFTVKLGFILDTSTDVPSLGLLFSPIPDILFPPEDAFMISLNGIGDPSEHFIIMDMGPGGTDGGMYDNDIPGIKRNDENVLIIEKKGNKLTFDLNGSDLPDFTMNNYPGIWFCIHTGGNSEDSSVIIEGFSVEYYGSRREL